MKKGIVTLSFDDGRKDNYFIFKDLLEKYKIPATVNIATGYIEGKVQAGKNPAMLKEEVIELYNNPLFEVAGHGDMHGNDIDDIREGKKKLVQWFQLPEKSKLGFASPGSEMSIDYIDSNYETFERMGFEYIRTGLRVSSYRILRIAARRFARVIHSAYAFRFAYNDTFQDSVKGLAVVSIPVLHDTTFRQVKGVIDQAIKQKKWIVLMFHSIEQKNGLYYSDVWTWDYEAFERLLKYISKKRNEQEIEISTTHDAYNKLKKEEL